MISRLGTFGRRDCQSSQTRDGMAKWGRRRYADAIMTSRTQITLDPELHRQARHRAGELGVSLAAYVRRLISRDLGEPEPNRDPSRVIALGDSGGSDVARDKDAMLADALARQHPERGARR